MIKNIKRNLLTLLSLLFVVGITNSAYAQLYPFKGLVNIYGITGGLVVTDIATAGAKDASALADLQSTTKGFLTPRLTTTQRDAISSPATGLLIFNTTTGVYNYYSGSWAAVGGGSVTSVAMTVPAFLSISGSPVTSSGTLAVSYSGTALPTANGGTGLTTYAVGDLIYGCPSCVAGDPLAKLADVAAGSYLRSGGVATAPVWSTTTLPNTVAQGDLLYSSATNVVSTLTKGSAHQYLSSNGTSNNPSWEAVNLADGVTGTLPVGNGGTGITSLGTGVATALGINAGSAGAFVVNGGALGTPSSGTATNLTGLPEGGLSLTDITTANVSNSAHGFFPKLTANSVYYVNNSGALTALTVGASGTVLTGNGVTSAPTWAASSSGITINSTAITGNTANALLFGDASNVVQQNAKDFYFQTASTFNHVFASGRTGTITGVGNSVFGYQAGKSLTSAVNNVLIGYQAGQGSTTDGTAVCIGAYAGYTGGFSTGVLIGAYAGYSLTSNYSSVAIGYEAMRASTSAVYCVAIGYEALYSGGSGYGESTAIGYNSLTSSTGRSNTAVGYYSLVNLSSGTYNVAIGRRAGLAMSTGSYSTFVGSETTNTVQADFSTAIGFGSVITASNQLVIGGDNGNGNITNAYIGCGVTSASAVGVTINATGGSGTNSIGANLTIAAGKGSGGAGSGGNGVPGSLILSTSTTLTTGTTLQTLVPRLTISGGAVTTDASTATWADALDFVLGSTTGTKFGTATSQKLSFFNATPIVQVGATTDLGVALSNLGLRAAGTAYPITTSGALTFNAPISTYNSVATAGWGVPAIYGSGRSAGATAAVASVATYTCGAADGSFEISANVLVTTSSAENFTVTCAYTDEGNTSRTITIPFILLAGTTAGSINFANGTVPYEGIVFHLRAKASTAITIATTGTFTGATYNVEATIKQTK